MDVRDLAEDADGVSDPDPDDADGHKGGGGGKDADEGFDLPYAADDLGLAALAASGGFILVKKELIVLVAGEGSAVGEQGDEAGGNDGPDDQEGRDSG